MRRLHQVMTAALFAAAAATAQAQQVKGADVYRSSCAMCHQAMGEGAAGLAPPLKGANWSKLAKAPGYLPGVLLAGMHGPLATDDGQFSGVMPTQNRLADGEIAAVSNYVAQELNAQPAAAPVAAADVAALRAKPATVAELRALRKKVLAK